MILVLLGTQDKPFSRVLEAVDELKRNKKIKDKVVAQIGCTKFKSDFIETFEFISKSELESLIEKAKIVISHGGVGIITECLERNKKVIVVPRLSKYKEHTNDHQLQITKEFAKKGYILPVYDVKNIGKVLDSAKTFKPLKYKSNEEYFRCKIKEYIDNL